MIDKEKDAAVDAHDEDILDDDSFVPQPESDGPPDEVCGCEDDRDMYDDD